MKKIIAIALVVVMIFGMIPATIFARTQTANTETTVENSIDGFITDGEYSWTSGAYDRNTPVDNEYYVKTSQGDTAVSLTTQWWLDYDEDYVYVAYREFGNKDTNQTVGRIDLNPGATAKGQVSLSFTFNRGLGAENTTITSFDASAVTSYAQDGTGTNALSTIFDSKAGSWYSTNVSDREVFSIEFKLNRKELAKYAGPNYFDNVLKTIPP